MMKIIDVVDGSAPLGEECVICEKTIGAPGKVLGFCSYDDMWDRFICKDCIGKAYEEMQDNRVYDEAMKAIDNNEHWKR
jgi:hypothetical protein